MPDFRGNEGFWRAYPPYKKLGLGFSSLANPKWFANDPEFAWGFYGHRLELCRKTTPHAGFGILRELTKRMAHGSFVFTSNVDGQFQRAGFEPGRIVECHGVIDFMQCTKGCGIGIFSADPFHIEVDVETFRAKVPLPACPRCGGLARPNILMFGDWFWDGTRSSAQEAALQQWIDGLPKEVRGHLVVIECGAGTAIPTVRHLSEQVAAAFGGLLVRINVRESDVPEGQIGLPLGAKEALIEIAQRMQVA
ncbi:MAG TPA: Sir2 family NAD-dependent protein deacetylase [Polyangium sp.]|nr:Sir2 family NAD-dependent protein deacetylase [Polyangium sp.]